MTRQPGRAWRGRGGRPGRRLAALTLILVAVAGPWSSGPAAASRLAPAAPSPRQQAARPTALVLVQRLTWEEAAAAARLRTGPVAAGLVSTLPAGAPLAAQVLSLAAGHRVEAGETRVERFRAANPDGCHLGLPPVEVAAAPGLEAAGLFAVGAAGTPPPPRPLDGAWAPAPGRLPVLAVPDAAGLAGVLRRLPDGTRILVAGLDPVPGRARTAPLLELGGRSGLVASDSTRRAGLVALEDVCPTLAATAPGGLRAGRTGGDGSPIRVVAAADPLAATGRLDRRVAALTTARTWAIPVLAFVSSLALVLLALTWWLAWRARQGLGARPGAGPLGRVARALVLLTLALPSGYLVASMGAPASAAAWLALGMVVGALLAAAAARLGRAGPERGGAAPATPPAGHTEERASAAPAWLGGVLLVLVAGDLLLGGHGLERPLLGGSAFDGERFYGLGNGYFALALASVMLVAAYAGRLPGRAVAAMLAGLAVVDGLPALGADVGGALTAMLTAALAWLLLDGWTGPPGRARAGAARGRRLAGTLAVLAVALAAGLALAFGVGLVTGEATHGTRFLDHLTGEGPAAAARLVARQLSRNARLLARNLFAWVGPLQVVAAGVLAAWPPAALAALVPARVRRVTLVGVLGSGLLILLNDTGVTATNASGLFLLAILAWSVLAPGARRPRPSPAGGRPPAGERTPASTPADRP